MKKSKLLIFTIVLIVVLAACSNNGNDKQQKTTEKDEMKVAEMMQEDKTHVWYVLSDPQTNELNEESTIDRFIVSKNGKMKVYMSGGITLADVVNESQKDIINDIKDYDEADHMVKKDKYITQTENAIKGTKAYIDSGSDSKENWAKDLENNNSYVQYAEAQDKEKNIDPKDTLKDQEDYLAKLKSTDYKSPKSQKINVKVNDDGTETITANRNYDFPKAKGSAGDSTDNDSDFTFNQGYQPIMFGDDNTFAGLSFKEEDEDFNNQSPYIITHISKDIQTAKKDEADDPAVKNNK
ncbi:hypothetical protein [Staphylococcus cohnii]|uniref:hypothetical protein n=1 Tax=Staphylococcus cohnii TaxID=29382 RepID=UPI003AD44840